MRVKRAGVRVLGAVSCLFLGNLAIVQADLCSVDTVPAATLLVPLFEVDYQTSGSTNTLLTVRNSEPTPALAHVTLWTNWGAPTLDFDLFLTGYGVEEIDLFAAFVDGDLPITADEQTDPMDLISPHGRPEWDGSFPECVNFFPFPPMVINLALRGRIQQAHTGQPVDMLGGDCLGGPQPDGIARGYITIDSVSECSVLFPSDPGYFAEGGQGVANDENRLTGEARIVDPSQGQATTIAVAHLEADPSFEAMTGATFYGRLVDNDGRDDREPLASVWSVPFDGPGPISLLPPMPPGGAELLVWRDPGSSEVLTGGLSCDSGGPSWAPLDEVQGVCFGPDNQYQSTCFGPNCFPTALNQVFVTSLGLPFDEGFCHFNLNRGCPDCLPGGWGPEGEVQQSFVGVRTRISGTDGSSRIQAATVLASACSEAAPVIPTGELFADGFERGGVLAWD